jgi:Flp pilus assembly protein TadD
MKRFFITTACVATTALVLRAAVMTEQEGGLSLRDGPRLLVDAPWMLADSIRLGGTNDASGPDASTTAAMSRATNGVMVEELLRLDSSSGPQNSDLLIARSWLLVHQGRFEGALENARTAKTLMPADPSADLLAGYCFLALGRTNDALRAYQDALRLPSAKQPDIHQNIGLVLLMQNDITNAMPHFAAAVASKPERADIWSNLVSVTVRISGVAPVPENVSKSKGEAARQLVIKAGESGNAGRAGEVISLLLRAHLLDPWNPAYISAIGEFFDRQGRPDVAAAWLARSQFIRSVDPLGKKSEPL